MLDVQPLTRWAVYSELFSLEHWSLIISEVDIISLHLIITIWVGCLSHLVHLLV